MTDYAQADMFIRLAAVPEMDPVQDKVMFYLQANRAAGYAREDDRIILAPLVAFVPEFDAFQDGTWIDIAIRNEGSANEADVTLSDGIVPAYTLEIEPGQTLLLRHYKGAAAAPVFVSTLGTTLRMFAWGEPYDGR